METYSASSSENDLATLPDLNGGRRTGVARRVTATPAALELAKGSPFIGLEHPITLYEGFKMVLMFPVVVMKLVLIASVVVYAWCIMRLMVVGYSPQRGPMHPLRAFFIREWTNFWARVLLFLCGYYYIPVKGWGNLEAARQCRAILVFNHDSYVDAVSTLIFLGGSSVAKSAVVQIPFIGAFCVALQLLFVKRRGSEDPTLTSALVPNQDPIAVIAERAADPRYPLVIISPEGTTKDQPCLLKFQRGAFAAGRPVCPMLVRYSFRHYNPGWGIHCTPLHLYRMMAQFINYQSIEVLPPYFPSQEERKDPALFAANVRALMGERLGVPLVDQGLDEWRDLLRQGVRPNWRGDRIVVSPPRKQQQQQRVRKKAE